MEMFQQDSATIYRFVFQGELTCVGVQELEHAWTTARSILRTKAPVVEISGITNADAAGVELLSGMRETGARLNAALPPEFRRVNSFNGDPGGSARSVAQHVADQHSL